MSPSISMSPPRRPAFSRLRTHHESTLRHIVHNSFDTNQPMSTRAARPKCPLPPRAATDVSGAALHAARVAEKAARDAEEAWKAAERAAEYARKLAREERGEDLNLGAKEETRKIGKIWPVVRVVMLGKRWSLDVVAVWNNAVRYELWDMFGMLEGLEKGGMRLFFEWMQGFEAFVVTRLKVEEEVLYPWVEQWGRIEGELSTGKRIAKKGGIIRGIRDVVACGEVVGVGSGGKGKGYYDGLGVGRAEWMGGEMGGRGKMVERVKELVKMVAKGLGEYFAELEKSLPDIIERLYEVEDLWAGGIERRMIRSMWKCGKKDECMVMLMRAVDEMPRGKEWSSRNFKRIERMAMPIWKRRYYSSRGAIVGKVRDKRRYWERNASSLDNSYGTRVQSVNVRMAPTMAGRGMNSVGI